MPLTVPAAVHPSVAVFVPVDMCDATPGRLILEPNRQVSVQAMTAFQCCVLHLARGGQLPAH
jgi:hypothetical protein